MGDTTRILAFLNCPAAYESEFGVELEQAAVFVLKAHDLNADASKYFDLRTRSKAHG